MVLHIVFFRPKASVNDAERAAMFDALRVASAEIPSVKRFRIGRRTTHGAGYEKAMKEDYPYAAIIEFADVEGLQSYLAHPQHEALGRLFWALLDAGLVYDYDVSEVHPF